MIKKMQNWLLNQSRAQSTINDFSHSIIFYSKTHPLKSDRTLNSINKNRIGYLAKPAPAPTSETFRNERTAKKKQRDQLQDINK